MGITTDLIYILIAGLSALGLLPVQDIVQPQIEASLNMVRQGLRELGVNEAEINAHVDDTRARHYALLES